MMAELAGLALIVLLGWALLPILARTVGALLVIVGLAATTSNESWAGWTVAAGAGLWIAGSWLHTVKTSTYSSPLASALFEATPLKWTLWQHWRTPATITTPQR